MKLSCSDLNQQTDGEDGKFSKTTEIKEKTHDKELNCSNSLYKEWLLQLQIHLNHNNRDDDQKPGFIHFEWAPLIRHHDNSH